MAVIMTIIHRIFGRTTAAQTLPQNNGEIETASREYAQAISELHAAQSFFDRVEPGSVHLIDEAIHRLNVAFMRVDNASRKLRELLGLPSPDELREARERDATSGKKSNGAA